MQGFPRPRPRETYCEVVPRQPPDPIPPRISRGRALLVATPLGVAAAVLLWIGDLHLTHRDWLAGAVIFALGLGATGLAIGQLRRAGLVR